MSYENEIQHLMRELKSAKSSYLNALLNSEDALMRHALKTDVETIEFQIDVFEKAAKTNEYEAKARAFDEGLEAVHDRLQHILHNTDTGKLLPGYIDGMYNALDIINDCYESGESDEL